MFNSTFSEITDTIYNYLNKHKYESIIGIAFALFLSSLYRKSKKVSAAVNSVKKKSTQSQLDENDILEVLFFSDKNALCVDHINNEDSCDEDCGYQKLK